MTQPMKECPVCRNLIPIRSRSCDRCRHRFPQSLAEERPSARGVHPDASVTSATIVQTPGRPLPRPPVNPSYEPFERVNRSAEPFPRPAEPQPYPTYEGAYDLNRFEHGQQAPMPPVLYAPYPPPAGYPGYTYGPYPTPYAGGGAIVKAPGTHPVWRAPLLQLLLTGGGQMYNGQVAKGFTILLAAILFGLATNGVGGLLLWPVALIDACRVADRLNRGEAVGKWQWF